MKDYMIYHNLSIEASAERVYAACVVSDELNKWWTEKSSGVPKLGAEYMFWFGPDFDWRAEVIEVVPQKIIKWRFNKADADWTNTELSLAIEERENSVLLHLVHRDWKKANEHFGRTSFCWAMYLFGLKEYLEKELE